MAPTTTTRHAGIELTDEVRIATALDGYVQKVHVRECDSASIQWEDTYHVLVRTHASPEFLELVADRFDMNVTLVENDDVSRKMAEKLGDLYRIARND